MAMAMFSVVGIWCEEFGDFFVQEAMVHGVEDFAVHDFFELLEVDDEAGAGIDFAFDRDFERVVVAVAVGVVAFAEDAAVFFRSEAGIVVVVRGGEFGFAGEIDHKQQLPVVSGQWPVHDPFFESIVRPFQATVAVSRARSSSAAEI